MVLYSVVDHVTRESRKDTRQILRLGPSPGAPLGGGAWGKPWGRPERGVYVHHRGLVGFSTGRIHVINITSCQEAACLQLPIRRGLF